MRSILKKVFLIGILFTLTICIKTTVQANSIRSIDMSIYVDDNGNAEVTETWNCSTSEGTEAYHPYYNLGNSKITNLRVSDQTRTYTTMSSWDTEDSFSEKAYKCGINKIYNGVELCWGISKFGSNVYTVKYNISGFVAQLTDSQMMYWTLIPYDFSTTIGSVKIDIYSNKRFADTIPVWGYGQYGALCYVADGVIHMSTDGKSLKKSEYMTFLAQFPQETFNTNNVLDYGFEHFKEMADEGSTPYNKKEESLFSKIIGAVVAIFGFLINFIPFIIIAISAKFATGKKYGFKYGDSGKKIPKDVPYYRDIPCNGDIFRAYYIAYQYNIMKNKTDVLGAIILKWLKQGIISTQQQERGKVFKKEDTVIILGDEKNRNFGNPRETALFRMMYEASEDGILENKEFEKWCKKSYEKILDWFDDILKEQRNNLVSESLIIETKGTFGKKYTATQELKNEALQLAGLKRFLLEYTLIKDREAMEVQLFEEYLIYAQILGIAKQVSKQFKELYPDMIEQTNYGSYDNIIYINYVSSRGVSSASSARAAAESYSSGGGGFSSGGGGGGSFGGGGGRRRLPLKWKGILIMIKKLAKAVREYKKETVLTPLSVAVEVVLEVIVPYYMALLIDEGINKSSMDSTIRYGIILIIFTVLSLIFGALSGMFAAKAGSGFAKNLRKDLYYKVQNFSFANIDKFSTSSIVTRLTTDVTNVQNAFQMIIRVAIRAPLMLIFSLIMAMKINMKMSFIFFALIPVVAIVLFVISRLAMPLFEKVFKKYDDLNNIVEENTSGMRVVKSFYLEKFEEKKFNQKSNEIYELFSKAEKILAYNSPTMQFAMYSAMILISWIGARIIVTTNSTELTTGELTSLITYAIQVLFSIMMLTMISVFATISMASAKRIVEILDEEPSIKNIENPIMNVENGSIEFKNVGFSYIGKKEKEVLKNINIKIESGETVGIIGGTGVGKSSLVNLIPRLYDVTEGTLLVAGKDVKAYDLKVLRDAVSCVLQKNVLFSGTIKENLRWGNENATDDELVEACKLAQADGFISEMPDKYDTYIEQGGTNVSGGQKQRICIARALIKNPKILILDDSTSAVDTKTDKLIRDAFATKIPNTTKIIIAQRISSVEDCDKIIVMNQGRIDSIGTHEELINNNEIYKEVYESQTQQGGVTQ